MGRKEGGYLGFSDKNGVSSIIIPKVVVKAEEDFDWFYPRTKRFLLRVPVAEFGLSCASVKTMIGNIEYIMPNRDYSYEGFSVLLDLENWKISDGFAFSIFDEDKNKFVAPEPLELTVKPNSVVYSYVFNGDKIFVTYQLVDLENAARLKVRLNSTKRVRMRIVPFMDIRHVYDNSMPNEHYVDEVAGNYLSMHRGNYGVQILIHGGHVFFNKEITVLPWVYKLGDGAREEINERVIFKPHIKTLYIPGFFELEDENIIINMTAYRLSDPIINRNEYFVTDAELELILNKFSDIVLGVKYFDDALFGLISTLYMLGVRVKPFEVILPEAGAWWFRTVWIRDLMEIISNNFVTLTRLRGKEWIAKTLKTTSLLLDKNLGLLPTNIIYKGEHPCSYTVDGTLKWVINYIMLLSEYWDPKIAQTLLNMINDLLILWSSKGNTIIEVDETTGLLKVVPCQSWIDTIVTINLDDSPVRVSNRLSINTFKELKRRGVNVEKYLSQPTVLLPEINAMWLRMLDQTVWLIKKLQSNDYEIPENILDRINDLLKLGSKNYIKLLWNNDEDRLNNAVILEYDIEDPTPTSTIVMAISTVPWIFNDSMLNKTWSTIERDLLVYRRISLTGEKKPFGIITRAAGSKIFKGDYEYHGYVVWPRDTPYLINLAYRLNKKDFIVDLLLNYLDASISESTIFHARELYALPEGVNPFPSSTSDNPIPVKNPSQSWSIFIDPFIKFKDIIKEKLEESI
jgi:hypothetical protein